MPKLLRNPRKINLDFARLTKQEANAALYLQINAHLSAIDIASEVQHPIPPGYRLLRLDGREGSSDTFEIALLNDVTRQVVYYNHVALLQMVDLNCRPASQMMVWRSSDQAHEAVLRDLAGRVFFNYILERYDVILSDNSHTGAGQFFWKRQMSAALARGLYVYFYRMMLSQLERIENQAALDELDDSLWGDDDPYEYHLAVISRVELPADTTIEDLE